MSPRNDPDSRSIDVNADLDMIMQKNVRKLRMKQVAKKKHHVHSTAPLQPLGNLPTLSPTKDKRHQKLHHTFTKKQLFDEKDNDVGTHTNHHHESATPVEEKRRSITIFDCAKIVNNKGRVMTHEEFELVTSASPSSISSSAGTVCSSASPSPSSLGKKTSSKLSKKAIKQPKTTTSEMLRQMAWEQMVLEIMCTLLPEIDVLSELNRTLVQGGRAAAAASMDLMAYQQQLHYHLNALHVEDAELPPPFTSGAKLVELYVTKSLVQSIVFGLMTVADKRAQGALSAIARSIFEQVPSLRHDMLLAIECTAVEFYNLPNTVNSKTFNVESMVTLTGSIIRLQHERSMQTQQSMFDDMDDEDDVEISVMYLAPTEDDQAIYEQAKRILALFCRSWSCSGAVNSTTVADAVFSASANLASNPTVKALIASVQLLAHVSPLQGLSFLSESLLRRWPIRNTSRQLLFLQLIPMLLVQLATAQVYMESFTKVVYDSFERIQQCIVAPHILVAREACALCDDLHLIRLFLLRDKALLDKMTTALHVNAHHHWNKQIQALSDDHFDSMLDLA
ncbi:hypothetical protein H310_08767 [Aphanomyces invadans]|uniref:Uncharacterized protein n=1 Tax=Aphanomyces invadans TaxID=157072 RepID=A0A024TWV9_9STRA|nr:hypothetical protein H310_08767 [Aphanomyces invadans]ETV98655.1 hypothetical protein H310_08767 [Aphanomyces invadans]|eukprot:XP_008872852.1 hypothetical protein H310_08767 [Aphanomyces invadans]